LKTNVQVEVFRGGVCIAQRTVRIDGTTEARHMRQALGRLHSGLQEEDEKRCSGELEKLEAEKQSLKHRIKELRHSMIGVVSIQ
jgi:hypothetical protein